MHVRASFDFSAYENLDLDLRLSFAKGFYENMLINDFGGHILNKKNKMVLSDISFKINESSINGNISISYDTLINLLFLIHN